MILDWSATRHGQGVVIVGALALVALALIVSLVATLLRPERPDRSRHYE